MKQGDEALKAHCFKFEEAIDTSSPQLFFSALYASSLLLLMENNRLTLHRHYFLKEIHRLMFKVTLPISGLM
jgi:hypothetical protein